MATPMTPLLYSKTLNRLIKKWPGRRYLGIYSFLPIFFAAGALLELCMIKWHVGEVNFYRTFKKRRVQELADERELAQ